MSRNPQGEPRTEAGRAFYEAGLAPGDRRWWSRATTDPDEMLRAILAIEAEAAAPVEGLRADERHNCANHDESLDEAYRKGYRDGNVRAALRAIESPAHPETGLDVERLARAIARVAEVGPPAHIDPADAEEHWPSYLDEAKDYVDEYAALRAIER